MFAFFNIGLQELVVLGGCFLFILVPAVVLAIVLPLTLRRRRPIEPEDDAAPRPPEERRPPPGGGEGITS